MKTLGILGGMGPLATVDLYDKIVRHTDAHSDSEHLHILIDSYPEIPDRTAYILGGDEDPTPYLIQAAKNIEAMGADYLVMPCNTAHYFYEDMKRELSIPFIHMIEEVGKFIKTTYPDVKKVGLLATEGTYKGRIYDKQLKEYGIEVCHPSEAHKKTTNELIYSVKEGHTNVMDLNMQVVIEGFHEKDIELIILGCTELPIAFKQLNLEAVTIDPTLILAIAAIEYAGAGII